jgi:hypothetical protein
LEASEAVVIIPRRPRIVKKWKAIVGPIIHIGKGLHIALYYVYPGPRSWRVEPHIVVDASETLRLRGVYVLEGPVALAKYRGLREVLMRGVSEGLFPSFHLAPWGAPVMYLERVSKPDEDASKLLDALGAWKALRWLERLSIRVEYE